MQRTLLSDDRIGHPAGQNRLSGVFDYFVEWIAPVPWATLSASHSHQQALRPTARRPLYTPSERARRDATAWTLVQGILAPIQFLVFLVSAGLVVSYLISGDGYAIATASVVLKTMLLYAIMITGSIWEKEVFGKYLFAPAFYWEDMVSMAVLALHTTYLAMIAFGWGTPGEQMLLALAAYATYAVNATQFIMKLRTARLDAGMARGLAA
jgi:3-vinyl bacteriochlorophyllide hydratase